jgi:two-component sensor histidine kinase
MAVKSPSVREFLIGKDDFDYCQHYNKDIIIAQTRREIFKEVKNLKKTIEFTDKILQPNGNYVYNLRRFFPILNESNEFVNMIGFGIDITEKTEQALQLENSLEEKEALLGEIHHRVKNNLALVLGLIEMQSIRTENDYLKNQFSEIHNRISAMSLIHEKLYKSTNFAKVDLKDYLQDLVKYLSGFFNKGKNVKLNFELEQIFASTKKAVPIALIVNELITNCFKYAFKEIDNGEIFVKLTKFGGETILTIPDNGPGIPDDLNLLKSNSLGFKLLNIFTKQLKGRYDFKNSPGLTITIKFKDEQEGFNS